MYKDTDILSKKGSISLENEIKDIQEHTKMIGVEFLFKYIENTLPDWLVARADSYCDSLDQLNKNWQALCSNMFKTTPQQIIIVDFLPTIKPKPTGNEFHGYKILSVLCDIFTVNGYVVRDNKTLTVCPDCNRAMMTEDAHNRIAAVTDITPTWKKSCCR